MIPRPIQHGAIWCFTLIATLALTVNACQSPTGDRWAYSHLYVRGQVTDTLGAVVPRADVGVQVFPAAEGSGCATSGATPATVATTTTDADGRFGLDVQSVPQATPFHACITVSVDPHTGSSTVGRTDGRFVAMDLPPDTAQVNVVVNP